VNQQDIRRIFRINPVFIALAFILILTTRCSKEPIREKPTNPVDPPDTTIAYAKGIFILNEGNFNWGNASVTFIDNSLNIIDQDIFTRINGRGIGDVAQSMKIMGDQGLILINNSNRIEVVTVGDFKLKTTITGLNYPRYIELVNENKAYVTNLREDISVIDLNSMTVVKKIKTSSWTEGLVRFKNQMFVTSVGSFSEPSSKRKAQVYVIDTKEDKIVDSILTGKEPIGIVIDKKEKMWILCSGGYDQYENPTLMRVDPTARLIEKTYTFSGSGNMPSRLCINPGGDTLYYLNNGVCRMPVGEPDLPASPLIPAEGRIFYGLNIHPVSGNIYVTDAVDYVQDGVVYRYNQNNGLLIKSYPAGRIPSYICFTPQSSKK